MPGSTSKRRWVHFRLRTLLIVVAILSVPLGYVAHEARTVQRREKMLVYSACWASLGDDEIPFVRRRFGDHGYALILLKNDAPDAIENYRREFPEAVVEHLDSGDEGEAEVWRRHPDKFRFQVLIPR